MHLPHFPVSVVGSIQPDRLAEVFQGGDDGMAARFLYAWPEPPKYRSILERQVARDDEALDLLQHIDRAAGSAERPLVLAFDHHAATFFDGFCERLHEDAQLAEGLEAGWLGKGRGTVARLAGLLALLHLLLAQGIQELAVGPALGLSLLAERQPVAAKAREFQLFE